MLGPLAAKEIADVSLQVVGHRGCEAPRIVRDDDHVGHVDIEPPENRKARGDTNLRRRVGATKRMNHEDERGPSCEMSTRVPAAFHELRVEATASATRVHTAHLSARQDVARHRRTRSVGGEPAQLRELLPSGRARRAPAGIRNGGPASPVRGELGAGALLRRARAVDGVFRVAARPGLVHAAVAVRADRPSPGHRRTERRRRHRVLHRRRRSVGPRRRIGGPVPTGRAPVPAENLPAARDGEERSDEQRDPHVRHFVDGNENTAPSRTPADGQRCVIVLRFV